MKNRRNGPALRDRFFYPNCYVVKTKVIKSISESNICPKKKIQTKFNPGLNHCI